MGRLRDLVRSKLEGYAERQAERETLRKVENVMRGCIMGTLEDARRNLRYIGVGWKEEREYGFTHIRLPRGYTITFTPNGYLSNYGYPVEHEPKDTEVDPRQASLF